MTESLFFLLFFELSEQKIQKEKKKAGGGDSCETEFIFLIHTLLSR